MMMLVARALRTLSAIAALVSACVVLAPFPRSVQGAAASDHQHLVTLNNVNFDEVVLSDGGVVFVDFYAPWCGHCKRLEPELEKVAKALVDEGLRAKVAKMDADNGKHKPIAKRYGVKGFPSLRVFVDGEFHGDYKGGRKAPHILSYLRRRLSRETVVQLSADAAAGFVDNSNGDNPVYLLVGGALETTPEGRAFEAVAEKRQEFDWFGHVPEPVPDAVLAVLGADRASLPAVVAVSPRSGAEAHSEEVDEAGLERFCNATKLPVVVELEQSVFPTVANSPRPSLLILQSAKTSQVEAACKRLEEALEPVARRHRMAAQFATVDMDKLGEWVRDEMGIVNPRVPTVVVYAKHADMMWFEEDWRERSRTEPEAVDSLLKSFMTREVTPTPLKTSPVMRKVEYYIATYPKIAIGMAFVPVVLAFLWWCTASSADEKTMRARRAVALERQMGRARADAAETVAKGEGSSAGAGGATQRRGAKRVD